MFPEYLKSIWADMQEISLNILDIAQNSIRADATLIEIDIAENIADDSFVFSIKDNGCGMSEEMVKNVTDPFVTTRTTRKIGLGIPLLRSMAQAAGGDLKIESRLGEGTVVTATFSHSHIDRQPLGDIASVISSLISMNPDIDFVYTHIYNESDFSLDTRELRSVLGEVSFSEPSVALWISEYVNEGLTEIYGGADL